MEASHRSPLFTAQRRQKHDQTYYRLRAKSELASSATKHRSIKLTASNLREFVDACRSQASIQSPDVRSLDNVQISSDKAFQKLDGTFLVVDLSVTAELEVKSQVDASTEKHPATGASRVITAGPKPYPIVGNIPQLIDSYFLQSHAMLQQYGPVIRLEAFFNKMHLTSDARVAEKIFTNPTLFPKLVREGTLYELRRLAGDGLFTASDGEENWGIAHRILMPAFSRASIEKYTPEIIASANKFLSNLQSFYGTTRDIPLLDWTTKMTFDTIGICGFGHDFASLDTESEAPAIKWMVKILNEALARDLRGSIGNFFSVFAERRFDKNIANFHRVVEDVVSRRRAEAPEERAKRMDLMSLMLSGTDTQTGKQMSDLNIAYQCATFLIAGHETTSTLLSWAFYSISQNPSIEQKLLEEIDSVFGEETDAAPTQAQLSKLKYTNYIIKETLRFYPPVASIDKALTKQEELEYLDPTTGEVRKGLTDPSAQSIGINTYSLHRNKLYWGDDAEEFKPERWAPAAVAERAAKNGSANSFIWLPFSYGPRACIGMQFALLEAQIVLAMFYRKFIFRVTSKVTLQTVMSVTLRPENLVVRLHNRPRRRVSPVALPASSVMATNQSSSLAPVEQIDAAVNLLVLFGSNTGSSEDMAHKLVQAAQSTFKRLKNRAMKPLNDGIKLLRKHKGEKDVVLIVTPTYNGQPPDNATNFNKWLDEQVETKKYDALSGCRYAVLGVGNSQWATFQAFPRKVDTALQSLGASRCLKHGEVDMDGSWEESFMDWRIQWVRNMIATFAPESEALRLPTSMPIPPPTYSVELVSCPVVNHGAISSASVSSCPAARAHAVPVPIPGAQPWKILSRRDLQSVDSDRRTLHLELQLPGDVKYEAGDHLGVCPRNGMMKIQALAQRLKLDLNGWVVINSERAPSNSGINIPLGSPIQIRTLLQYFVDLSSSPTMTSMAILTEAASDQKDKTELLRISTGDLYRKHVLQPWKTLLELLTEFPSISLSLSTLLDVLPRMQPRFYSISSSPLESKDFLSITVGIAQQISPAGRLVDGVCSNFLASLDPHRDSVIAFVRDLSNRSTPFKLPSDPSVPIIMVGAGTGIAPYMGFLQQRRALLRSGASLGEASIYFGCRNSDIDDLYSSELKQFQSDGALSHLHVAYSRQPSGKKVYSQHLIARDGEELWNLIHTQKARVFVCGSASGLAQGVHQAFINIVQKHGNKSEEDARALMSNLEASGAYVTDVWG